MVEIPGNFRPLNEPLKIGRFKAYIFLKDHHRGQTHTGFFYFKSEGMKKTKI
jgi:hypothetical protein